MCSTLRGGRPCESQGKFWNTTSLGGRIPTTTRGEEENLPRRVPNYGLADRPLLPGSTSGTKGTEDSGGDKGEKNRPATNDKTKGNRPPRRPKWGGEDLTSFKERRESTEKEGSLRTPSLKTLD